MKERVLQEEEELIGEAVEAGFQPDGLIAGILFLVKVIFPLNFGREAATQRVAQQHNSRRHANAQNHRLGFCEIQES